MTDAILFCLGRRASPSARTRAVHCCSAGDGGGVFGVGWGKGPCASARCYRTGEGCLTLESQAVATLWWLEHPSAQRGAFDCASHLNAASCEQLCASDAHSARLSH